jgi:hypothetical protein
MRDQVLFLLAVAVTALAIVAMRPPSLREGLGETDFCGNVLVQKGDKIVLRNTSKAEVPGVNPIIFDTLEDYVEYMQWMRSQGINCPVLYLREQYNAQNECSYKLEPDPANPGSFVPITDSPPGQQNDLLVDAGRTDPVFNRGGYPSFDPQNQNVGRATKLDDAYGESQGLTADAAKTNWGGVTYSEQQVAGGKYADDYVYMAVA